MSFYQFKKKQVLQSTMDEIWEFISTPKNLKEITPKEKNFEILNTDLPKKMYPGMIVFYKVNPLKWFRTTWVTEITNIREKNYFIDEQRVGPYSMWHHQHIIEPTDEGVQMTDIVSYRLPLGILGRIAHRLFIRAKIESIFNYRQDILNAKFN